MPFGIPSEDFHGGFGLPHDEDEVCVINYDDTDGDVSDEEYKTAAQETYDNLVHSLTEAGGEICELKDEKVRLIFALKEAVVWLNYFLTTERNDIYYDDANEVRCRAEYLLMDLEE